MQLAEKMLYYKMNAGTLGAFVKVGNGNEYIYSAVHGAASAIPRAITSIHTAQHVINNTQTNGNSGVNSGYLFCENVFC